MKILYVDVYFFINFTVDLLCLFFAAKIMHLHTKLKRVIISAALLSLYAVITATFELYGLGFLLSATVLFISVLITAEKTSILRRIKFALLFLIFQILFGGVVYFAFCFLDRVFEKIDFGGGTEVNRKLLILSVLILFTVSVLKIIILIFKDVRSEKSVPVYMEFQGKEHSFEALVDSGNLAVDPLDATPVMLIKEELFKRIFGIGKNELLKFDTLSFEIRKRIRTVPIKTVSGKKLLYGIKSDVHIKTEKQKERVTVIIALDECESTYGGFFALVPLSLVEDL